MTDIALPVIPASKAPTDFATAVRTAKKDIISEIGSPQTAYASMMDHLRPVLEEIIALRDAGKQVWPQIDYDRIASGAVTEAERDLIRARGCLVIRGHFPREQALDWDARLEEYVDANDFARIYRGAGDDFFSTTSASKPAIYPIYWSPSQMEARQSSRMNCAQSFLNRLWKYESNGTRWFDPDRSIIYPDRIRRRAPGSSNGGLGAHCDSGSLERWLLPAYRKVYSALYAGRPELYDPWDAAHRPQMHEYEGGTTKCSVFRTFQGWTALSDMRNDQGVLHTVPAPEALGSVLLRALLPDVAPDELCGVQPRMVLAVLEKWHPELHAALTPIPDLRAGDSVWWHADVIHSVAAVQNQDGWGNVMYIPAAPACTKNLTYARHTYRDFLAGRSPHDFPAEHYETDWSGRFTAEQLTDHGRRAFDLDTVNG
ncbi:YbiU family protein [Dermatophilus congolensis]|uniref:YbiU family protein n=1 Tax=Dermatophilus congolensis TaxID=1863 RepID=UPI001AAF0D65